MSINRNPNGVVHSLWREDGRISKASGLVIQWGRSVASLLTFVIPTAVITLFNIGAVNVLVRWFLVPVDGRKIWSGSHEATDHRFLVVCGDFSWITADNRRIWKKMKMIHSGDFNRCVTTTIVVFGHPYHQEEAMFSSCGWCYVQLEASIRIQIFRWIEFGCGLFYFINSGIQSALCSSQPYDYNCMILIRSCII